MEIGFHLQVWVQVLNILVISKHAIGKGKSI